MRVAKTMIYILLTLIGSLTFIGICHANNKYEIPILAVTTVQTTNPPQIDIGQTLTVNISVIDVTDLYTWQVHLSYNNNTLEFLNAIYPSDHVFAGKLIVSVTPVVDYDRNKETWFVEYGCSLMGAEPGFNGSGRLCQIMFRARAIDGSYLNITDPNNTYLLDSNLESIVFVSIDSSVAVVNEFSSLLLPSLLLITTLITVFYAKKYATKKEVN